MEQPRYTKESSDLLSSYPRSYASASEGPINRSRPWSEDITKYWNVPITGIESFNERAQRYLTYFQLTPAQIQCIYQEFLSEMISGLNEHKDSVANMANENSTTALKMSETYIDNKLLPTGKEKGASYSVDLGGQDKNIVYAAKIQLQGDGKLVVQNSSLNLKEDSTPFSKGLLDPEATASMLFDSLAKLVQKLQSSKATAINCGSNAVPVGVSIGFPVEQRGITQSCVKRWTKGYETGRKTSDPVESIDLKSLFECAFKRVKFNASIQALQTDAVSTLIAGIYEKPVSLPACCVGFVVGCGVSGCYIQPDANANFGYKGCVINCELGAYDKSLPINDIDLEVDFGDESTEGTQIFEKMVATTYLGELCRRLVVKVWQSEAPQLAWVRHSISWIACARIIETQDEETMDVTDEILKGLWDWETTLEQRKAVRQLFQAVFERSAILASIGIVALATTTGQLQPALGGVTCAISGALYHTSPFYQLCLDKYAKSLLSNGVSDYLHLSEVHNASLKGAGILGCISKKY